MIYSVYCDRNYKIKIYRNINYKVEGGGQVYCCFVIDYLNNVYKIANR